MTSQTLSLNLIPKGISPRLYVSQYDKGQEWNFEIYAGAEVYTIPSESSVTIQGTKPDKTGFQYACSFSGNRVTATEQQQMTILAGEVPAEIRIEKNNEIIATLNFIIVVEKAALADDTVISETELPLIEEAIEVLGHADELVNQIQGYATTAQNAASTATTKASQASTSATNASNSATTASNAATTATNKASEATTAASTATTKASQASTSATSAAGSASTATTKAQEAAASAAAAAQSAAHLTIDGEMSTTSENALQNKVVTSAIQNLSNQVNYNTENGVKNILPITLKSMTANKVAITVNADGTITVNSVGGEASSGLVAETIGTFTGVTDIKLSGCPSGGNSNTYCLQLKQGSSYLVTDSGSGATYTCNPSLTYEVVLVIRSGQTISNKVFKPMVTLGFAPNSDYAHFQPYTLSNSALTTQVNYNTNNGVKNALPFPYDYSNKTTRTIVANVNADCSISISGTNSASSVADVFHFSGYLSDGTWIQKYAGKEIVVKCEGLPANSIGYAPFILYDSNGTQLSRTNLDSSTSMLRTTIPSNVHHVIFSFYVRGSKTISTTLKPMFCESFLYDIDSSWSSPAHSNIQLTQETTGLIDNTKANGAVNMLPTNIVTQVFKGATITHNSDGSYSVVKSTADSQSGSILSTAFTLKAGTYYWSASQHGHSAIGSDDCYCFIKGINGTIDWYRSTDFDVNHKWGVITLTQDSSIQFGIVVGTGTSNFTFYPMITVASYDGDYVPYAKTNKELTEDVADIPYVALTDNASSQYTLIDGKIWQTKGVTFLYVAVQCNTVSPIAGGNHIKVAQIPDNFKKPQFIMYPAIVNVKNGSTHIGAQFQINTNGQLAVRGGETGGLYSGLFSY